MLRKVLIGLLVVLGLFIGVVATRPDTFHIERSISIAAPPSRPYALVSDFHQWGTWSPWEKVDPTMKRTYSGAPSGTGAVYAWAGNGKAGEGRMTIREANAPSKVLIDLEFIKPFPANNVATFTFADAPSGATKVTWAMDGKNNFFSKAFQLFADMDKLVGADFEKGLVAMKANAESSAATPAVAATQQVSP